MYNESWFYLQFKHILLPNVYSNGVGSQVLTTLVTTVLLHFKHTYK